MNSNIHKKQSGKAALTICLIVAAFLAGILSQSLFTDRHSHHQPQGVSDRASIKASQHKGNRQDSSDGMKNQNQTWTCSMHPQFKLPKPGKCPICFMDLIPLEEDANENAGKREVHLSKWAAKAIGIETSQARRQFVETTIRMTGKIAYDETKISYISAWVPGRLERMFVNYTGIAVKKGEHMVEIYSPDLLIAQEELIQARKTFASLLQSDSPIVKKTAQATIDAAREKLRLLGFNEKQIYQIETSSKASEKITIYSPQSGFVIHKAAKEGMYVQTGTRIYTIASLSTVWVKLDAYESDLKWLQYGSKVEFTTEAYKGKSFTGTISFIDLDIDENSRTAKVRVTVKNDKLELKPGMFVRAVVRATIADNGDVVGVSMEGKWICPMHPDIVKDYRGDCDICGMDLVTAASLGYVSKATHKPPLVIPSTSPLFTGKRAVVYVQLPDRDTPTFAGREIEVGAHLDRWTIVKSGLKEEDRVVTRGAFKLDAELQIRARPSMMSMTSEPASGGKQETSNTRETYSLSMDRKMKIDNVLFAYYKISSALSKDNKELAQSAGKEILANIVELRKTDVPGKANVYWMQHSTHLKEAAQDISTNDSLASLRESLRILSEDLLSLLKQFPPRATVYKAFCPMAFNNSGAFWLTETEEIANPYFGSAMFRCGEIKGKVWTQEDD